MARKKRYTLRPEHAARFAEWKGWWIANALSCEAMDDTDRAAMMVAVRGLYEAAQCEPPPPQRIVFTSSPMSAAIAATVAAGVWWLRENPGEHIKLFGRQIGEAEFGPAIAEACAYAVAVVWQYLTGDRGHGPPMRLSATAAATDAAMAAAMDAATDAATAAATAAATRAATANAIAAATAAATDAATRAATRDATYDATAAATHAVTTAATRNATDAATRDAAYTAIVLFLLRRCQYSWRMRSAGNQWSAWVAYLSFFRHVARLPIDYSRYDHWEKTTIHAGPRYVHQRFVVASDRPQGRVSRDEQNRPHCGDGPQQSWRDGFALWFWHGIRVPRRLIEAPASYTAKEIHALDNTEVVRALAERLGWQRFLEMLGGKPIDAWTEPATKLVYELHAVTLHGEVIRFLRKQSSVLKNGTQPYYLEPVPETLKTARAARKWQAMAAFLAEGDDTGALELVQYCNAHPELEYAWEA